MTDLPETPTLRKLEAALHGQRVPGVEVLPGERPVAVDADTARALSAPLLAAFVVAAAILRVQIAHTPLDLPGLLLRTAAAAFCVRALILMTRFVRRAREDRAATEHTLAFCRDGVLWHGPRQRRFVRREDVIALRLPNCRASRLLPGPRRPLLLATLAAEPAYHWSIPPYFSASSEILRARLARTLELELEVDEAEAEADRPAQSGPIEDPTKRYADAAAGHLQRGDTVVPEGHSYRARGPYGVLLGAAFGLDALAAAGPQRAALVAPALLGCAIAVGVPAGWLWLMRRRVDVRLGIAMLLTPQELLVRGEHGVVSLPYNEVAEIEVQQVETWSPFFGAYTARTLVIHAHGGSHLRFDEGFLGIPPEVVAELCAAYRRGRASVT